MVVPDNLGMSKFVGKNNFEFMGVVKVEKSPKQFKKLGSSV
jgi:hypothetical protein